MLSTLSNFAEQATALISANPQWVAPAVFTLCLVESLPFLALIIPGTAILLSVGALVGAGEMSLLPIWLSVTLGAGLGNAISFFLGQRYGGNLFHFEWARKRLHLYAKAQAFFARWGWFSIVACRFIGPLRSTVPLIAGTCAMSPLSFHISSWASAALWASVLLLPGWFSFQP